MKNRLPENRDSESTTESFPEILSSEEVDRVLGFSDTSNAMKERRVQMYDFLRPDKLTRDQILALQMIHESFARLVSQSLTNRLQAPVSCSVASVDQLSYGEFARSVSSESPCAVVSLDPMSGAIVIAIDPGIAFSMISVRTGHKAESEYDNRPFTEIDNALLEEEFTSIADCLKNAWDPIMFIEPRVQRVASNPSLNSMVASNEFVMLIAGEISIEDAEGMIYLCVPYAAIEPALDRLSVRVLTGSKLPKRKAPNVNFGLAAEISVYGGSITLDTIQKLTIGSSLPVLNLQGNAAQADIFLGGAQIGRRTLSLADTELDIRVNRDILKIERPGSGIQCKNRKYRWFSLLRRIHQWAKKRLTIRKGVHLEHYLSKMDLNVLINIAEKQSPLIAATILSKLDETRKSILLDSLPMKRRTLIQKLSANHQTLSVDIDSTIVKGLHATITQQKSIPA